MADLIKSGYLTKLDVVSQKSWKKRFFALNASSISYFESHQVATKPKGSIVLVYGSTVQRGEVRSGKEFIIEIKTPFTLLILSANSEEECNGWIEAIDKVLKSLKELPRAYITKRGGIFEGGNSRKYFILHNDCLTWHQDEEHVKSIKGSIPLTSATVVNYLDANLVIDLGHENIK